MENIFNITVGSDPELFIYDTKKESVVSSIGIIPGVKGDPYRPEDLPNGFGLEIDNILAEFNIPPAKTEQEFVSSIEIMKSYIDNFVKKVNPNYTIIHSASQLVPEDQLQSEEAKLFGCSVDYNCYTEKPNPKPQGDTTNLRSTGFHIHVGYENPNIATSVSLVKYMDMYLGIPSVIIDNDKRRRSLYGKAGCFRLTDYGVEYRVLSGYFISSKELESWAFNQTLKAFNALQNGDILIPESDVIQTINKGMAKKAKSLCSLYNISF